jgi:hypothetical protein ORF029|nr:MAG TPA: ribonucleoside-diphosphate reductase subunit alpha [Caudoviricetes sp.]
MSESIYDKLSKERKRLQKEGLVPEWFTTGGYSMFTQKYEYDTNGRSVRGQFERIAKAAAKHLKGTKFEAEAEGKFFDLMWNNWLSLSTPIMSNMGTDRALPVSCSGGVVDDSINGFYKNRYETAILTKHGFGTSAYLGGIRPRGTPYGKDKKGTASGIWPVFKGHAQDMIDVAQGSTRRGAWAGYLEIDHKDFDEVYDHIYNDPDGMNVGWIITDAFLDRLRSGDSDAIRRYQRCLKMKMVVGRGYFWFVDKVNRKLPEQYKRAGMKNHASNLCVEIALPADNEHQFTCVLSSMLVHRFDEWKDTDAVYWATIFLDCVAEEFIQRAKDIDGLEKTVRFTQKARALGLGQAGLHTYLQDHMIPFESLEARMVSQQIAKHIWEESLRASQDMAKELGEPEWCRGFGVRNASRIAIAPTKSSAIMFGGVSEGINPDPAMVFTQKSAGGSIDRIVPSLLKIMKERGVYNKKTIKSITEHFGSVQHVDWLSDDEKAVFKTAFEINQKTVVALASARGRYIDQWQSLNLFFAAEERPEWISEVHQQAFEDPNILGLYYIYTQAGIGAAKETECVACQ